MKTKGDKALRIMWITTIAGILMFAPLRFLELYGGLIR